MYDAIVVGARCAGSPLAMLLARRGWSVLLLDKNTFPSDTMSTHFIHPTGIARLKRWGLLDQVVESNCPPITQWILSLGSATLAGRPPPIDGIAEAYCPRRIVLDEILVRAAREAGAELREGFAVREVLKEGERVIGIRGETRGGSSVTERAAVVIGADGVRSIVARAVGAPIYEERPPLCCAHYAYWADVSIEGAEFYLRDGRVVFAFPTNDGLVCTFIEWPRHEFDAFRADVEGNFLRTLELAPGLAARIRRGRRTRHFVGTADLPNFFRKPFGPGWALAGDAGHHQDPCGGYGISDAFRDAELLASAIDAGLSGRQPLDEALAEYERDRNEAAMPAYELNYQMASLRPQHPTMERLYAALTGNQADTDRFIGAVMGTVSIPEFFSPANVARITGSQSNAERPTPAVRDSAPAGELAVRFAAAASAAQRLPHRPDNSTQLKLYALYKQSTAGDAEEREPDVANFVARAKHGAWAALRGITHEEAMRRYADLVESLQEGARRSVNEPALK
jgi:flavin-dependent dehydrogenase/acyl-CoA-binding protein